MSIDNRTLKSHSQTLQEHTLESRISQSYTQDSHIKHNNQSIISNKKNSIVVQSSFSKQFSQTFDNPIQPILFQSHNTQHSADTLYNEELNNHNTMLSKQKINTYTTQNTSNAKSQSKNMNKSFFAKTQVMLDTMIHMDILDKKSLQKGIDIQCLTEDDSPFFKLHVETEIYLACIYSYILDEKTFAKNESPKIHFIKCGESKLLNPKHTKVCIPTTNAFDYRVRANGIDTRLFYEHPLSICQTCMSELYRILSKKYHKEVSSNHIKEHDVMNLLIKNKLKNLVL